MALELGDPSPKFHVYPVIGEPFGNELFTKENVSPRQMEDAVENDAMGLL